MPCWYEEIQNSSLWVINLSNADFRDLYYHPLGWSDQQKVSLVKWEPQSLQGSSGSPFEGIIFTKLGCTHVVLK